MENWVQYAPYIIIVVMFCANYKIFVTPDVLDAKLERYVLKETYNVTISEMKSDIADIKNKVDKIYDKLISG